MRVAELRHELQSRGLETDGTKVILVSRLQYAIEQEKRDAIQLVIEKFVLPGSDILAPHIFLGDEAFALLENLLKPYPRDQSLHDRTKAIFNYRLSRARRIVENAFGLLSQNFRIFHTPINLNVDVIEELVSVACILHNLIIEEKGVDDHIDVVSNDFDPFDDEGHEIEPDSNMDLRYKIRDTYKEYFNSIGAVPWQNDTFRL